MGKVSAGLLLYRQHNGMIEIFLVHPGGPFWRNKDRGAWSIPKGEYLPDEDPLAAAKREFTEETGFHPREPFIELTPARQAGGKVVRAWAFEGDADPRAVVCNTFSMEWPPRSGRQQTFPEIDRAAWFPIEEAKEHILKGQMSLLIELQQRLPTRSTERGRVRAEPTNRARRDGGGS